VRVVLVTAGRFYRQLLNPPSLKPTNLLTPSHVASSSRDSSHAPISLATFTRWSDLWTSSGGALLGGLVDILDRSGHTTIFSATVTILCLATERNRVTNIVFACVKFWRHVE